MMPSVLMNGAIAVLAAAALTAHSRKSSWKILLRYFTALSNLFCAAASLAVVIARLCGYVPPFILAVKFVGTAAVAVTFLTVMLFLGPFVYDYKTLLTGPDLWLHLVCPVLAVISCILWDRPAMPFGMAMTGILPVLLYGALYLYHVVYAAPEKRWEDFYGFNRNGKWLPSFAMMAAAAFLISSALWIVCNLTEM